MLKNLNLKDVFVRAYKTFFEAFLGAVSVISLTGIEEVGLKAFLLSAFTAGISAGLSAVWNMAINYINRK